MILWSLVGTALGLLFLVDGLRMRRRLASLAVLGPTERAEGDAFAWLVAKGISLNAEARSAAVAFAETHGLDVVDLVPARWNVPAASAFAQVVDPVRFRREPLAPGYTAGCALLVRRTVLARANVTASAGLADGLGPLQLFRCARRLKRYAPRTYDFAIAPGLDGTRRLSPVVRHAILQELFGVFAAPIVVGQLALLGLTAAAASVAFVRHMPLGWAALVVYNCQAAVALLGSSIRAPDLIWSVLFALPKNGWDALSGALRARPDPERLAQIEVRRPFYREALSGDRQSLFLPRQSKCPVCGGDKLRVARRQSDLLQHKPGTFTLERCADCGHLFQNPQLAPSGLAFYYGDFYGGLGEEWLESVFGLSKDSYGPRAREIGTKAPQRWLDVGGGYGHFALLAKEIWPETRFECLDVGESALESVQRGWSDAAHRGFLPELADSLAGQFDVVSLSHCLEHTPDPRAEIAAARTALSPAGALLIEVPDPECLLRHLFRRYWLPYFQPQHLHLLSVKNLSRLLTEAGFSIERVSRGPAHIGADGIAAAILLLDALAPPPDVAWRPAPAAWHRLWRGMVWSLGTPLLFGAFLFDGLLRVLSPLPKMSNAYRVLARRAAS